MQIRPLDPNEPSQFGQYADIHRRALEFENPYATPFSAAELYVQLARPNPAERLAPFAGYDGDVMVAAGLAGYWLIDNTEKVRHDVWVAPEHRRKGLGSAMEELLVDEARRQGRTTLLADFGFPFDSDDSHPPPTVRRPPRLHTGQLRSSPCPRPSRRQRLPRRVGYRS